MSYKEQLSHIEMLAIEESEELFYKLDANGVKNLSIKEELTNEDEGYFDRIFVYGFDIRNDVVFEHNTLEWSKSFMEKAISQDLLEYDKVYFKFELVDNRHLKLFTTMRYPLIEQQKFLGEVYVGIEATHWAREQVRIFCYLVLFNLLADFLFVMLLIEWQTRLWNLLYNRLSNKSNLWQMHHMSLEHRLAS